MMKRSYYVTCVFLFSLLASCNAKIARPIVLTTTMQGVPSATSIVTPSSRPTPAVTTTSTPQAVVYTPSSSPIVLPVATLLPDEAELAISKLLKTNGNCIGKCIAGIQPDDMIVQDAIDVMGHWGMVRIVENSQGKTFVNLVPNSLDGQAVLSLSVGTWTRRLETIDRVSLQLKGVSELFIGEEIWQKNQEAWYGFNLKSILEAYGLPSFVGYFFETTVDIGAPLEGRTIRYGMDMQFEKTNMVVLINALAYYDGENLMLCPSKDPHALGIEINPESSLTERKEFYPVTWQALTVLL